MSLKRDSGLGDFRKNGPFLPVGKDPDFSKKLESGCKKTRKKKKQTKGKQTIRQLDIRRSSSSFLWNHKKENQLGEDSRLKF